jgi:CheY-like chemotaxis protein
MKPPLVAIADDDAAFANYLKTFLDGRGYQSRVYSHGEDLLSAARAGELPDVVLLDVMMPGLDGLATLRSLKSAHPDLQVIMLSGRESAQTIVEALNLGAVNYVVKPDDPDGLGEIALETAIKQAIEKRQLVSEVAELRRQVSDDQALAFWANSDAMSNIATIVDRVADNDVTVLLRGESGVGKELVARAIHDRSVRRSRPFESQLRGRRRSARVGAVRPREGRLHRRGQPARRQVRARRRRHADARRDRRDEAANAGQAAARPAGRRVQPSRQQQARVGRRARGGRHEPRSREHADAVGVPRRPVLPAEGDRDLRAAAAGTRRRNPAADRVLHGEFTRSATTGASRRSRKCSRTR